jgi:DNA-binding NarL/FixJ family response regulator
MARKLDSMDLKQIITLHLDGISNLKIASTLGISRNTVNHYLKLFSAGKYDLRNYYPLIIAALIPYFLP